MFSRFSTVSLLAILGVMLVGIAGSALADDAVDELEDLKGENLLIPDLVTLEPEDFSVEWEGDEKRLRFQNDVANQGVGVMELYATDEEVDCLGDGDIENDRVVYQRIYRDSDGRGYFDRDADTESVSREVGCIYYHERHDHWHFSDFALYELRDETGSVASSEKVSFCLTDTYRAFDIPGVPDENYFGDCPEPEEPQGISVGWVDRYAADLVHQWVVITDVPDGEYCLVSAADPHDQLLEANPENNSASMRLRLDGDSVTPLPDQPCPAAEDNENEDQDEDGDEGPAIQMPWLRGR